MAKKAELLVRLPDRHLACCDCGQATPVPTDKKLITWPPVVDVANNPNPRNPKPPAPAPTARCRDCQRRADQAAVLLDRFPQLRHRYGDGSAEHMVFCALLGLAAMNDRSMGGTSPIDDLSLEDLLAAIDLIAGPAAGLRFVTLLAPVAAVNGSMCARRPWAHLGRPDLADAQSALRAGYLRLLAHRVAGGRRSVRGADPGSPDTIR